MKAKELYEYLKKIPQGKVVTYASLANHFGTSPRAIASMLGANREMDTYPCYRVVHSDGKIGWYRGWVDQKIRRLEQDGIRISNGRIDLKTYGWITE